MSLRRLNVNYWVGVRLCYLRANARTLLLDDVAEDFAGKLFALIMANDADLNLLFRTKVLMIVHLASDKGIGTLTDGVRQEKIACSATNSHLADRSLQQFVALGTLYVKLGFHQFNEGACIHGGWQFCEDQRHLFSLSDRIVEHRSA